MNGLRVALAMPIMFVAIWLVSCGHASDEDSNSKLSQVPTSANTVTQQPTHIPNQASASDVSVNISPEDQPADTSEHVSSTPSSPSPTVTLTAELSKPATPTPTPTVAPVHVATPAGSSTPASSDWERVPASWSESRHGNHILVIPCWGGWSLGGIAAPSHYNVLFRHFLEWSADSSRIIFGHGSSIQSIDTIGSETPRMMVDVNPLGDLVYGHYADLSPLNSQIAYSTCQVYIPASSEWNSYFFRTHRFRIQWLESFPYLRVPDDPPSLMYSILTRQYEIATVNLDGSDRRRLTENILFDHFPTWSPDEASIAFVRNSKEWTPISGQLYVMDANGSNPRLLASSVENVAFYPPVWSPDGQYISFIALEDVDRGFDLILYTVGIDDSNLTRIGRTLSLPSWSPDGLEIAFSKTHVDGWGVYAVQPDGTGLRQISQRGATQVSWSPDGSELILVHGLLYFGKFESGIVRSLRPEYGIAVVGSDGSGYRTLGRHDPVRAAWSPDGSRIALLSFEDDKDKDEWTGGFHEFNEWEQGLLGVEGEYNHTGEVSTIARDGSDHRVLVRWERNTEDGSKVTGKFLSSSLDHYLPSGEDTSQCSAGIVVPDPESNFALVQDCEVLVHLKQETDVRFLNWRSDLHLADWEGVVISGSPPRVRELKLPGLGMSGTIPPNLGDLSALRRLDLRWNDLSNGIPPELGDLTELRVVDLSGNKLYGRIPAELGELAELKALYLHGNELWGEIPTELGQLGRLEALNLSDNALTGVLPSALGRLSSLQGMYISDNLLTGTISATVGRLSNLRWLNLSNNQLTGDIPSELGDLANLEWLILDGNHLSGSVAPALGRLRNLSTLSIDGLKLTGCLPHMLPSLWYEASRLEYCEQ